MSYSTWLTSRWYTLWSRVEGKKEDQLFTICDYAPYSVSYKSIKSTKLEAVLEDVKEHYTKEHWILSCNECKGITKGQQITFKPVSSKDLRELKKYMLDFIRDVDSNFKK